MDEIKDIKNIYYYNEYTDNEIKKYDKPISTEQKIIYMKLLGIYKKIYDISNNLRKISLIEEEIYKRYNVITEDEKILFELKRIKINLSKKKNIKEEILEDFENIILCYELYKNSKLREKRLLLNDIYECIIMLQLKLGMNIGLYKEAINIIQNNALLDKINNNKLRKMDLSNENRNR